jgi:hypothetical protein
MLRNPVKIIRFTGIFVYVGGAFVLFVHVFFLAEPDEQKPENHELVDMDKLQVALPNIDLYFTHRRFLIFFFIYKD